MADPNSTIEQQLQTRGRLWRHLHMSHTDLNGRELMGRGEDKSRTLTISNFLKDMHNEVESQSESQIVSMVDLKYCESEFSRKESQKQLLFMVKLLVNSLKDEHSLAKKQLVELREQQGKNFGCLKEQMDRRLKELSDAISDRDLKIRELVLELREANSKITAIQKQVKKPQNDALIEENKELRDCLKDLNHLAISLHDKNNILQDKLTHSREMYQKKLAHELKQIRLQHNKMLNDLRQNLEDQVSDKVLKYIGRYESLREEDKVSQKSSLDAAALSVSVSPQSNNVKRFGRTSKNSRSSATQDQKLTVSSSVSQSFFKTNKNSIAALKTNRGTDSGTKLTYSNKCKLFEFDRLSQFFNERERGHDRNLKGSGDIQRK